MLDVSAKCCRKLVLYSSGVASISYMWFRIILFCLLLSVDFTIVLFGGVCLLSIVVQCDNAASKGQIGCL